MGVPCFGIVGIQCGWDTHSCLSQRSGWYFLSDHNGCCGFLGLSTWHKSCKLLQTVNAAPRFIGVRLMQPTEGLRDNRQHGEYGMYLWGKDNEEGCRQVGGKKKGLSLPEKKEIISSSPVLSCYAVGFVTSVTYTQRSFVRSRQSLYKVNSDWPRWGHSLPVELLLFAVPLLQLGGKQITNAATS